MKVVIEEKVKHRLVGIAVILSVGVVFAPAVLKKSQRRFEDTVSVSVKLPPKPIAPQVSVRTPNTVFQTVKVARADAPTVNAAAKPVLTISKAEPLSPATSSVKHTLPVALQLDTRRETASPSNAKGLNTTHSVQTAQLETHRKGSADSAVVSDLAVSELPAIKSKSSVSQPSVPSVSQKPSAMKPLSASKTTYGVQLATFAVQSNAIALVNKLKTKGYPASFDKIEGKNGQTYYKVIVGHASERQQAQRLQKQLSQAVQINGFVVSIGVS